MVGNVKVIHNTEFPMGVDYSLTAASPTPEPPIPDSVLDAQNQVAAAQQVWRDTEARYGSAYDMCNGLEDWMSSQGNFVSPTKLSTYLHAHGLYG